MAALHPKDFFKKDVICIFWLELNDVRECGTPARSHVGWYNKAYRYFTDKGLPVTARDSWFSNVLKNWHHWPECHWIFDTFSEFSEPTRDRTWQPVTVPHLGLRIAAETLDFSTIVVPRCSKLALLGFVFGSFCFRRLWWLWWSSLIFNRLGFYTNANWLIHALQLFYFFSFFLTPTNQVPWPWYHFMTRPKKS